MRRTKSYGGSSFVYSNCSTLIRIRNKLRHILYLTKRILELNYCTTGHAVAQLVEALRYKPEGCGFDSRWCHWNFSLT